MGAVSESDPPGSPGVMVGHALNAELRDGLSSALCCSAASSCWRVEDSGMTLHTYGPRSAVALRCICAGVGVESGRSSGRSVENAKGNRTPTSVTRC